MPIESVLRCFTLLTVVAAAAFAAPPPDAASRFGELVEREWQWRLREFPTFATAVGVNDYNDRLGDASLAAAARRDEETAAFLAELDGGRPRGAGGGRSRRLRHLPPPARGAARFGALRRPPADAQRRLRLPHRLLAAAHGDAVPDREDYDNYLSPGSPSSRPGWTSTSSAMREGLRRGMTIPKATLAGIETSIRPLAEVAPEAHPVYSRSPAARRPPRRGDARAARGAAARGGDRDGVIPGYARFLAFMTNEYVPGCRETLAATALPDGEAYYRFQIRVYTTLDMDPQAIHELGLREVAAIRAEMAKVIAATGFDGSFEEFLHFLRTDPRFYAKTPEELLKEASYIAKRMDAKLPSLFGRLPRQPYGVMAVPAQLAPKYTTGRYSGSPKDSTEPGWYWVNTYALDMRPLYNLEALTLHEAVPGHHLQGALAEEAESVRPFRRSTTSRRSARGGGSTPSTSATRPAFTPIPTASSAIWATRRGARCGWSSTPESTPSAGAGSGRSSTWQRTRRCRCTKRRPRSTATSRGPARRCRTTSAT
jgi:uncharacterized protein (DUF885 family)